MTVTIKQIAEHLQQPLHGEGNPVIREISIDSRTVIPSPHVLFLAIKGERHDGHDFIPELIERGILNFITEKPIEHNHVNVIVVPDAIHALQQMAGMKRDQYRGEVIGITGSNGKTTVKEWLWSCLSRKQKVYRSPKSYNSQVGVPLSVWEMNEYYDTAIIEAGISQPGEMPKLQSVIKPTIGIFTTLGDAHQKKFASLQQKLEEKMVLFKEAGKIFYNADEELVYKTFQARYPDQAHFYYSRKRENAFLYIRDERIDQNQYTISVLHNNQRAELHFPFQDRASVENLCMTVMVLLHLGFSFHEIQEQVDVLEPVAMRLEQLNGYNDCTLINDSYNSDLTSVKIAIDFLHQQKQHQKTVLILSDIVQSGIPEQELYHQVADLVKQYRFSQFIGIGETISRYKDHFPENSLFYNDTTAFVGQVNRQPFQHATILVKGARVFQFERIVQALEKKQHRTVLEVNYNAIIHNLNYFKSLLNPGTKILVMVKALAYGSGGAEIARMLQHQRVDYLGVAFADEGIELRKAGITLPILVMNPSGLDFQSIIDHRLEPEIYNFRVLKEWIEFIRKNALSQYPVHLKIDTGMHRLGFDIDETNDLAEWLKKTPEIKIRSVFSHLAATDMPEHDDFTRQQISLFEHVVQKLPGTKDQQPIMHVLNSAGIERFPDFQFDMVRLGIGLYGVSALNNRLLQDISRLKTHISQIKQVRSSETIGYGRKDRVDRDTTIAILPIGYADGISRKLGNGKGQFWLKNKYVKTIGNICMDLCMIDITGIEAKEGDEVVIFGPENPITDLAGQLGTIPYEILTSISSRVKKVYFHE